MLPKVLRLDEISLVPARFDHSAEVVKRDTARTVKEWRGWIGLQTLAE
jgi:hypothetical protein